MCTVLLAHRFLPDAPLVLASNRDEFFGRASSAPSVLHEDSRVVGGQDVETGGTWLAVSHDGRVATVTNRRPVSFAAAQRSRGELPLAMLLTADRPQDWIGALDPTTFNPFNLLYASPEIAVVGHAQGNDGMDVRELDAGLHVLTLCNLDQTGDDKVDFLAAGLASAAAQAADADQLLTAMEALLSEHGDEMRGDLEAACVHGDGYGTVSSSSVLVRASGDVVYRHAQGPPCTTPFSDLSALLGDVGPVADAR
jgi:uncharacterized protein with NRDE domain